jgi:hypothetical protein
MRGSAGTPRQGSTGGLGPSEPSLRQSSSVHEKFSEPAAKTRAPLGAVAVVMEERLQARVESTTWDTG